MYEYSKELIGYTNKERLQQKLGKWGQFAASPYIFAWNYFVFMSIYEWRNYFTDLHTWKVLVITLVGGLVCQFVGVFIIAAINDFKLTGLKK